MTAMMAYSSISRWSGALGVCAIVAIIRPAHADPRAVVELFTSQGCSSCPPADKIIGELAKDPSVIALSMPIDYWDYLGWKDTLADARFSARQKAYSQMRGDRDVYTPQVVVNGSAHLVGSDRVGIYCPDVGGPGGWSLGILERAERRHLLPVLQEHGVSACCRIRNGKRVPAEQGAIEGFGCLDIGAAEIDPDSPRRCNIEELQGVDHMPGPDRWHRRWRNQIGLRLPFLQQRDIAVEPLLCFT